MRPEIDRPGVALMLVLWLVVVLGVIAATVVTVARSQANTALAFRSRAVARYAAESGVVAALAEAERLLAATPSQLERAAVYERLRRTLEAQGVGSLGEGRFQVAVEDLNARIQLNTADYATLLRLFGTVAGEAEAPARVAAVLDWRDEDQYPRPGGAEAAQYESAGSPFRPPDRPFQRVDELARVLGVGDSVAARLSPHLTVDGGGLVNANTASATVLMAATGVEAAAAERLVRAREGGPFGTMQDVRSLIGAAGAGPAPAVSLAPTTLLLVSRGWAAARPLTHEIRAVVELRETGGPAGPALVVVRWVEHDR